MLPDQNQIFQIEGKISSLGFVLDVKATREVLLLLRKPGSCDPYPIFNCYRELSSNLLGGKLNN
jgi:hypothetical protein